jgi:hypothetical protein
MDPNLMSCPTCSHTVSNIAEACAYCGAILVKEGQPPQTDDNEPNEPGENAQVVASPPPLSQDEIPPTDKISDEAGETHLAATGQSESNVLQPLADSPAAADTSEPATEAETVSANESVSLEEEIESKHPDDEPELEPKPESAKLIQDLEGDSEIASIEAAWQESVSDADAEPAAEVKQDFKEPEGETAPAVDNVVSIARNKVENGTVTDEIQSLPEPEVVDIAGDETGESETSGENIAELSEIEASQPGSGTPPTLEKPPPLKNFVEVAETIPVEELQPKNETDINIDARAGSLSDLSSGTILLELDDEVEPVAGVSPDKIEETEMSEPQALKIENAAQELSAAIEEQKAALTKVRALKKQKEARAKAQALKKQKEVLAKTQALKKQKEARAKVQASKMQKLVLANVEALKRKKAVQAKAQALTKQKAAQATIEAAKKGDSAAVRTATAADRPKSDRSLQAGTTMQTLLEKFKGRVIGINYDNSAEFKEAQLVEANAEYFCVFVKDKGLLYSYPLKTILTVIEGKNGVDVGDKKQPQKFNAVIKVYPLVLF